MKKSRVFGVFVSKIVESISRKAGKRLIKRNVSFWFQKVKHFVNNDKILKIEMFPFVMATFFKQQKWKKKYTSVGWLVLNIKKEARTLAKWLDFGIMVVFLCHGILFFVGWVGLSIIILLISRESLSYWLTETGLLGSDTIFHDLKYFVSLNFRPQILGSQNRHYLLILKSLCFFGQDLQTRIKLGFRGESLLQGLRHLWQFWQ